MYFKNELSSWDDIRAFQCVAEASGLSHAAKTATVSAPTLGRRILRLEQDLGVTLFDKHQTGYQLTAAGHEFLYYTRKMQDITSTISLWQKGRAGNTSVKISAGNWTAWFIASFANTLFKVDANVQIELIADTSYVDLLRREANIGIRNKRAKHPGLISKNLTPIDFAIYGNSRFREITRSTDDWISDDWTSYSQYNWIGSLSTAPSAQWVKDNVTQNFVFSSTSPQCILKAAETGLGLCVLPCFVGNSTQNLIPVSPVIPELHHKQWLVAHKDDQHFPALQTTIDALVKLWADKQSYFITALRPKLG